MNSASREPVHGNTWNPKELEKAWPPAEFADAVESIHQPERDYRERAGGVRNDGCPVHHIVPKAHVRGFAPSSRELMWNYGIGVRDLANLVQIGPAHAKIHTNEEYERVWLALRATELEGKALQLNPWEIRENLLNRLRSLGAQYKQAYPCTR